MRRWNGWGEENFDYPLPGIAASFLADRLGEGDTAADASLEQVLARVPDSALPDHPLVDKTTITRLMHSRGQSLPDWIALKSGKIGRFPDGVAFPSGEEDLRSIMQYARNCNAVLIAFGGGTSVVGHINPGQYPNPVMSSQPFRTLLLQELIKGGVIAPSFIVRYSHDDSTIDHTVDVVDRALCVYRKSLDEGVERYLVGPSVKSVYRRYN